MYPRSVQNQEAFFGIYGSLLVKGTGSLEYLRTEGKLTKTGEAAQQPL